MGQLIESIWAADLWFSHNLDHLLILCCSFITKMKASRIFFPFLGSQMRTRWSRWANHVNFVLFQVVKYVRRLKWYCSRVVEMHTPERNVDGSADTIHGVFSVSLYGSVHICITLQHVDVVDDFLGDLAEAVVTVSSFLSSFCPNLSSLLCSCDLQMWERNLLCNSWQGFLSLPVFQMTVEPLWITMP